MLQDLPGKVLGHENNQYSPSQIPWM